MKVVRKNYQFAMYANDVDAFIPELWANTALAILVGNLETASLVHRDFENTFQAPGDIVNTRKPRKFTAKRKDVTDNVTKQDAVADNIPVPLNQHIHTSFMIYDSENTKSFQNLMQTYLVPAVVSIAEKINIILLSQALRFIYHNKSYGPTGGTYAGSLGTDIAKAQLIQTERALFENKVDASMPIYLAVSAKDGASLKSIQELNNANTFGDDGTKMQTAALGRMLGVNVYRAQGLVGVTTSNVDVVTGAINNASGELKGDTSLTVDGFSAAIANGTFFTVEGSEFPYRVASTTGGSTPTVIGIAAPGLRHNVADNAVVTLVDPAAVNNAAGYSAGYSKAIIYDGQTNHPAVGQACSFAATGAVYGIIEVDTSAKTIVLDRPLEADIADNDPIFLAPVGTYNMAFQKNALALVTRPLKAPMAGTGALAFTASQDNLSLRVVISYDGNAQGHLVTVDCLCGIQLLDPALGATVLS